MGMDTDVRGISDAAIGGVGCPYERDAALGPLTWYGVGGAADVLAQPQSVEQLAELGRLCDQAGLPLRVLGSGANLLVADGGVRGVVVQLTAEAFCRIEFEGDTAVAGGGADLARLIMVCARRGLGGLEVLAGIPASIGGAVRMNAGGKYGQIAPLVAQVTAMDAIGNVRTLGRDDLQFDYRSSNLTDLIITEVRFDLTPVDPADLRQRVKEIFAFKTATQPLRDSSAGCAFKNPTADESDKPAGKLIDEAGLKGLRIGAAEVSPVHANFIVVHKDGAADDVLAVMDEVERSVAERFGVTLRREVVVWKDE